MRTSQSDRRVAAILEPMRVLYWIYAGRLIICLTVYGLAALVGDFLTELAPVAIASRTRLIGILGLAAATFATPVAYWHSHRRDRRPGTRFLLSQAALDVVLVTGIVHVTGGSQSPFVSLFIGLAAAYALILPLSLAVGVAIAAGGFHLVGNLAFFPGQIPVLALLLQASVFTLVALATSFVGARFRVARQELRSIEGELRRLRLDTADILRIIPSGVLTLDSRGRVAYMNVAAAELLGVEASALLGRPLVPVLESLSQDLADAIGETLETGRRIRGREVVVVAGGETGEAAEDEEAEQAVPVAVSTTVIQEAGAGPSHVVLLQDLRPSRQLEDLRLRTGRLEAVAELSASLAHELKNPLASVRSAVEQLAARAREDADDRVLGRVILRESDRMNRILAEFSDFARVDVSRRRPVDVLRLLEEVAETARQHPAAANGKGIVVEADGDLSGLWGDPELLHRTLLNLVLNALQVGEPERPVEVRIIADNLRPDTVPRDIALGEPVRIRVIDDGPGIEPGDLRRIFDPFYTRRKGGSGLGLSIAHRAVQAHGGTILASSELRRGSTFTVVLPRRRRQARPPGFRDRRGGSGQAPVADVANGRREASRESSSREAAMKPEGGAA